MAINLATKFQDKTSELLKAKAKTSSIVNQDWSSDGTNAIKVWTLTDPTMNNYTSNGANRYGSPNEVQDTVQTFTLSRDRSWTNTIDMLNYQDTMEVRKPAKFLAQATKNVLVPEIDTYRLAALATAGLVHRKIYSYSSCKSGGTWHCRCGYAAIGKRSVGIGSKLIARIGGN